MKKSILVSIAASIALGLGASAMADTHSNMHHSVPPSHAAAHHTSAQHGAMKCAKGHKCQAKKKSFMQKVKDKLKNNKSTRHSLKH